MIVRLLGPIDITIAGAPRPVPGVRLKALLAALALRANRVIGVDELIDMVWPDATSVPVNSLQGLVSRLRRTLPDGTTIVSRSSGYLLEHPDELTDLDTAQRLIRDSRHSSDASGQVHQLTQALALWRGRPLADLDCGWADQQRAWLDRLKLDATIALAQARLELGDQTVLADLEPLAEVNPLDERVHHHAMLALYRAGRQADALALYERLRGALADQLGVDPGQGIRDLHIAILSQDLAVDPVSAFVTIEPTAEPIIVPAQLPAAITTIVGRADELTALDQIIAESDQIGAETHVEVVCLSGTAGVGKTTLAVHWAHRMRHTFADGSLYANLRGFDPSGVPVEATDILRRFLAALGVAPGSVPVDPDAMVAHYRSVTAGKRLLILLDNARDADHVRPLLPGTGSSLVIVTSRRRLTSLAVTDGAHQATVDLLTDSQATQLIVNRLGASRVAAEPDAVAEIIDRCARLPLALAIVAARAAARPGVPLDRIAADLRDDGSALDELDAGDPIADVRAAFRSSCDALSDDAGRMFRLLGLHSGPDITIAAAASLAGVTLTRARTLLAELDAAQLVTEPATGRYAIHDLLCLYATEQSQRHDSADERRGALARSLDHYLRTATRAMNHLDPHRDRVELPESPPGVCPQSITSLDEALAWFSAEHSVLLATIDQASEWALPGIWQLVYAVVPYLQRQGHICEWARAQRGALEQAQGVDDVIGQAHAHRCLGVANSLLRRDSAGHDHLQRALHFFAATDDVVGQAQTHLNLAWLTEQQGRHADAIGHGQMAFALYRAAGHEIGPARALNSVGWNHALIGDYAIAIDRCAAALTRLTELGDVDGQAWALDSLGYSYRQLGAHDQAIDCYRRSLVLIRERADRGTEWETLIHLGDAYQAMGKVEDACSAWHDALEILVSFGHSHAGAVRDRLMKLSTSIERALSG